MSTGLKPIEHPPGNETIALPVLANKGPKTKIAVSYTHLRAPET